MTMSTISTVPRWLELFVVLADELGVEVVDVDMVSDERTEVMAVA